MRIANNIMAMNTHRQYTINNNNVAKSAEKLSSGYRINRAGDDAAGLAISEKMRSQIRGLNMAAKNSMDAISLVQTAEGALQEVHAMLQRMNELAVQSATDTNETLDRNALDAEFQQLVKEIDDIASQTTFNNKNLLNGATGSTNGITAADVTKVDGTAGGTTAATKGVYTYNFGAASSQSIELLGKTEAWNADLATTLGNLADTINGDVTLSAIWTAEATATGIKLTAVVAGVAGGTGPAAPAAGAIDPLGTPVTVTATHTTGTGTDTVTTAGTAATTTIDFTGKTGADVIGQVLKVGDTTYEFVTDATKATGTNIAVVVDADDVAADIATALAGAGNPTGATAAANGDEVVFTTTDTGAAAKALAVNAAGSQSFQIQVGALEGETLDITINSMSADSLGVATHNISNAANASKAITASRDAINQVSDQRALLGAMQNRLEHKIANLNTSSENLSAAESRIRDIDIAKEMSEFTKNNILSQAATAMLAQANAAPQQVLSLLR